MFALLTCRVFSKQKTATAVAHCKRGNGLIKVNGRPLETLEPEMLRFKVRNLDLKKIVKADKLIGSDTYWIDYRPIPTRPYLYG